ncbi:MAG: alpha/beta fold hydrolase [Phycisphaerales bacterium JB059]
MMKRSVSTVIAGMAIGIGSLSLGGEEPVAGGSPCAGSVHPARVSYRTVEIQGMDIFYREAGPEDAPVLLLLHGFPSSGHQYRELIDRLSDTYRVIAPDYPGFGMSAAPDVGEFDYTFDRLSEIVVAFIDRLGIETYSLYVFDYGAPVGFRVASGAPERVDALIVQNGNAYEEGLGAFWEPIRAFWADPNPVNASAMRGLLTPDATRWQYTNGVGDPASVAPESWIVDQALLDRPGNSEIQLAMFYDYRTNVALYPEWQSYFREHQPPTLIVWGENDAIFPSEGATPYLRDLPEAELHMLPTGHFVLEEYAEETATLIRSFMDRRVERTR